MLRVIISASRSLACCFHSRVSGSCSIESDTLQRSLQLGFQVQNDIVEQTGRNWVCSFLF